MAPSRLVPALLLLLLAGGAAGWLARARWGTPPPRASEVGGTQRLEARLELLGHGAWYGFTLDRAATLRFEVELPDGVESSLVWGRLGAGGPDEPAHLPDPVVAERIALVGGLNGPYVRRASALGPHVLFVEQPSLTMGEMRLPARVRLQVDPDPPTCPSAAAPAPR